jgi:hypothetical protein
MVSLKTIVPLRVSRWNRVCVESLDENTYRHNGFIALSNS